MDIPPINNSNLSKIPESYNPNVVKALGEIQTLVQDSNQLVALSEELLKETDPAKIKDLEAQITALQGKIATDADTLSKFMKANPTSFNATAIGMAEGLATDAENLQMLPPTDATDLIFDAGYLNGNANSLWSYIYPKN